MAVIVNASLVSTFLFAELNKMNKIRVSNTTLENTCLYPASQLAFLIISRPTAAEGNTKTCDHTDTLTRIEKLMAMHRHSFVVWQTPHDEQYGSQAMKEFHELQSRFLDTKLQFLVTHNASQAARMMTAIAKPLTTQNIKGLHGSHRRLIAATGQQSMRRMLQYIGLDENESAIVQDCFGSIRRLSGASREELLNCGLGENVWLQLKKLIAD